jgi:hypothetical protein
MPTKYVTATSAAAIATGTGATRSFIVRAAGRANATPREARTYYVKALRRATGREGVRRLRYFFVSTEVAIIL